MIRAPLLALLACAAIALFARSASAHAVGVSRGEYRAEGASVHAVYAFSATELAATLADLDVDRDGRLSASEVAGGVTELADAIVVGTSVGAHGPCAPRFESARATENDAVEIRASFACSATVRELAVDCGFLERFSADHRHLAVIAIDGRESPAIATYAKRRIDVDASPSASSSSFLAMVGTGVRHILTGYDHLAFLVGLLLLGGRLRDVVATVTAFTVAHSITLALAAMRLVALSPSFVEPAIALSIAYVGVENLFVRDGARRWRVTFPFGLLHGFGFAGALMDLELSPARLPGALFAFNLGVEAGQLAVIAAVFPLLELARRGAWFRRWGVRSLSVTLALAGLVWFVLRVPALQGVIAFTGGSVAIT